MMIMMMKWHGMTHGQKEDIDMIEFVGSKEILDFAKEEGFETIRMTYEDKNYESTLRESFNVFEVSEEEFEKMSRYDDPWDIYEADKTSMIWKDHWGWWRYATGCTLEDVEPRYKAKINGNELTVWYSLGKMKIEVEDWVDDFDDNPEHYQKLMEYWIAEHSNYHDLFRYCIDMLGVTTEKNITAIAVGLAQMNNMKLSDLFKMTIAL